MSQSIETMKRRGTAVVENFNRQFTPNTPCFYQPTRGVDKWYPTRTRSEAWILGSGEPVVQIDGTSGCVSIGHLAMPGSELYEAAIAESEEAQALHVAQQLDETAADEPGEQVVYHYAASVNLPQGKIHYDGILNGPIITGIEDYRRYRAEIAADVKAQVEQVQVHSMTIVGLQAVL